MICDDCVNRTVNTRTGIIVCKVKHIECSTKGDAMFCSSREQGERYKVQRSRSGFRH